MASGYAHLQDFEEEDIGDDAGTDADIVYFTEASAGDTDLDQSTSARFDRAVSLPLRMNATRHPPPPVVKNKRIYVMFMRARRQGARAALSFRDYLVNDVLPQVTDCEYVHTEVVFGDDHLTISSAMNEDGITFTENKLYLQSEYPVVYEIEVGAHKYNHTLDFTRNLLINGRYDKLYFYLFCCIGILGIPCNLSSRDGKFTCAAAVATVLSVLGIGDNATREQLRKNKNITADQLEQIMDKVFGGVLPISQNIVCIRKLDGPPFAFRLHEATQSTDE